jgi:uncharacterized protein with ParB-like and HNH nuclease domain
MVVLIWILDVKDNFDIREKTFAVVIRRCFKSDPKNATGKILRLEELWNSAITIGDASANRFKNPRRRLALNGDFDSHSWAALSSIEDMGG